MKDEGKRESTAWQASWTDNREDQLARTLAATPAERLAWLEEMIEVAFRTGALPKRDKPSLT